MLPSAHVIARPSWKTSTGVFVGRWKNVKKASKRVTLGSSRIYNNGKEQRRGSPRSIDTRLLHFRTRAYFLLLFPFFFLFLFPFSIEKSSDPDPVISLFVQKDISNFSQLLFLSHSLVSIFFLFFFTCNFDRHEVISKWRRPLEWF